MNRLNTTSLLDLSAYSFASPFFSDAQFASHLGVRGFGDSSPSK